MQDKTKAATGTAAADRAPLRIPIRFKILIIFLLLISLGVGGITFTMANLFHTDKTAYIHDLTSVRALNTANEVEALLTGYLERLGVFSRIMASTRLLPEQKNELLSQLFEDFQEFVCVAQFQGQIEKAMVYDVASLEAEGLEKVDLLNYRLQHPFPESFFASDEAYIENSTVSEGLPTLTLSVHQPAGEGEPPLVTSATVRLEMLRRLALGIKGFEIFLADSGGKLLAQSNPDGSAPNLLELPPMELAQGMVQAMEYSVGGQEVIGAFARTQGHDILVGVHIPKSAAYLSSQELLKNLLAVALGLLIVAALVSLFWSRYITRPLERLTAAAKRIGQGQFDVKLNLNSRDEIGDLAGSFNQMAVELNDRETELKHAHTQLVQSEKLAAFGQLGAGIAHEVTRSKTPLPVFWALPSWRCAGPRLKRPCTSTCRSSKKKPSVARRSSKTC